MASGFKALDDIFSKWTRLRFADWKGEVQCYTCFTRAHWTLMQAGHFIRRGVLALRWEPDNVRPQCPDCNEHHNGQPDIFEEELRGELGDARVDEMLAMRWQETHLEPSWYDEQIVHYTSLVKALEHRI